MKYRYEGALSVDMVDGKEIIWKNGTIYDFDKANKRVQKLVKLGYLTEIKPVEKITKGNK